MGLSRDMLEMKQIVVAIKLRIGWYPDIRLFYQPGLF